MCIRDRSTTTYTGADALFENESYAYYKLSETPAYYITAWYNPVSYTHLDVYKRQVRSMS